MKKLFYLSIIIFLIITIGKLATLKVGITTAESFNNKIKTENKVSKDILEELEIYDTKKEKIDNLYYITGKIKNKGNTEIKNINISIDLYNKTKEYIDATYTNIEKINPSETQNFKAIIIKGFEEIEEYKININIVL